MQCMAPHFSDPLASPIGGACLPLERFSGVPVLAIIPSAKKPGGVHRSSGQAIWAAAVTPRQSHESRRTDPAHWNRRFPLVIPSPKKSPAFKPPPTAVTVKAEALLAALR